jgi:hypothetical protein
MESTAGRVRFVIAADPLYQDHLEHLGYLGIGNDRFATSWFPTSASVSRHYERFAASIEQMVRQSAGLVPVPWKEALLEFLGRVERSGLRWWLYGSAALAIRGIDVAPRDIDVNVSDAALTGRLLDDLLVTPVLELSGWVAKRVGRAFDKAIIEWLSEPRVELDDPLSPHEQGPPSRQPFGAKTAGPVSGPPSSRRSALADGERALPSTGVDSPGREEKHEAHAGADARVRRVERPGRRDGHLGGLACRGLAEPVLADQRHARHLDVLPAAVLADHGLRGRDDVTPNRDADTGIRAGRSHRGGDRGERECDGQLGDESTTLPKVHP